MSFWHRLSGVLLLSFAAATQASQGANARSIEQAGNRLLLGTLLGYHVSDDNGERWTRLASLPCWSYGHDSVVDPYNPQHWYLRYAGFAPQGDDAFFCLQQIKRFRETRDGGLSWLALALPGEALTSPIVHPAESSSLGVWYRDALIGSSTMALLFDGGVNWTPRSRALGDPGVRLGAPLSGRHFVGPRHAHTRAGIDVELNPSADHLSSWSSAVATGRVSSTDLLQLFRRDSNPQQLFGADATTWGLPGSSGTVDPVSGAVATFPETAGLLMRLREDVMSLAPGGAQWQTRGGIRIGVGCSSDAPFFRGLLDAGNGTLWLADSSAGLQRSTDGGARCGAVGGQRPQDVRSLARSLVDPDQLVATASDDFYRSRHGGLTWQRGPRAIDTPAGTRGWRDLEWCANNDSHLLALPETASTAPPTAAARGRLPPAARRCESNPRVARRAPGRVYLLRSNSYAVTADCGVTYTEFGSFGGQSRTLAVDPNGGRHLVASGMTTPNQVPILRISDDGDASWTTVVNPGMYSVRNGWIDACDRERITTYNLRVFHRTVPGGCSRSCRRGSAAFRARMPSTASASAAIPSVSSARRRVVGCDAQPPISYSRMFGVD